MAYEHRNLFLDSVYVHKKKEISFFLPLNFTNLFNLEWPAKIYLSTCLLGNILTCQRLTTAIVFLQLIPEFPTIFFVTHLECVTNSFSCLSKSESALSSSGPRIAALLTVHIEQCRSGSARLSAMFLPTCESLAMSVPL